MTSRCFNVTGQCIPEYNYMVDISARVEQVKKMVDRHQYFTINRPRQYGKTTLLSAMRRRLSSEYVCAFISFEGFGDESFESEGNFCAALMEAIQTELECSSTDYGHNYANSWLNPLVTNFRSLNKHITKMCEGKKVVLLIDEVDKSSNNRVFIHFIGLLRDKFLRQRDGTDSTFQSVILAGVHDIRNLKVKLEKEGAYTPSGNEGHMYNSPWNIASPFLVDMSFSAGDIAGMLNEYESDHHTGMDAGAVSGAIFEYSGGYPFLVSRLCQVLDEDPEFSDGWNPAGVAGAVKSLLGEVNTLFDDITKNLENYPELYSFIYNILILGERVQYVPSEPVTKWASMFGFVKKGPAGFTAVANRIFEIYLSDYFITKESVKRSARGIVGYQGDIIEGGRFDMELCLTKFAGHFREIFTEKDAPFIEEHGRMLFLTYLRPLINGAGFYHIESQLTDQRRMDLVVEFGRDQFIIELKLWHGESAHEKAYSQLAGYLKGKGASAGYLLTYDFRKDKNRAKKEGWVEWGGVRIFDVLL